MNFKSLKQIENEIISMSRAWDKKYINLVYGLALHEFSVARPVFGRSSVRVLSGTQIFFFVPSSWYADYLFIFTIAKKFEKTWTGKSVFQWRFVGS